MYLSTNEVHNCRCRTSSVTKKYASGLPKMPEARLATGSWGLRDPEDDGNPNSISIMDVHVR